MRLEAAVSKPRLGYDRTRNPIGGLVITGFLVLTLGLLLVLQFRGVQDATQIPYGELVFWAVLVLLMNLIPFNEGELSFTLDTPILLAVALLYPSGLACLVAFIGSMDLREVLGRVTVWRALFNRTQIGLSVLLAGIVFRLVTDGNLNPWALAAVGTAGAVLTFHGVNVVTVGVYTALRTQTPVREALTALRIGPARSFLATYLGYGVLALVLAHLFVQVGPWSVALFLIPLLVARQMLVRGEALERLAGELRHRERLLERLFDRIIEERRDERLRIATGLHDDVLQSLIRMSQLGAFLQEELSVDGTARRDAQEISELARATLDNLRNVVSDLQRSPVGRGGLVSSLRLLAQDLKLDWRKPIEVSADEPLALSPEAQIVGYQAAREAVINSLKHADASRVRVSCRRMGSDLVAVVSDDGTGFQPDQVDESQHFGLGLMRRRVELAGGQVQVKSSVGEGTTVTIQLPADAAGE
jgi:signal transduction histidine kinase